MSKNPQVDWGNTFADTSDRHCNDLLLRQHGYSIWQRKGKTEPIWLNKKGEQILESIAVASIKKAEA